jgi:predicted nucleic acid-binding protein
MSIPLVIDACVALKWRFRDEDETEIAIALLSDAMKGIIEPVAPTLWIYEITNATRTAVMRGRVKASEASDDLNHFLQAGVQLIPPDRERFPLILSDAIAWRLSVYDASYIDLARQMGCDFYTGDRRLYNSVGNTFSFIHWIGEYKPPLRQN